jgi:hypothetical protein
MDIFGGADHVFAPDAAVSAAAVLDAESDEPQPARTGAAMRAAAAAVMRSRRMRSRIPVGPAVPAASG